MTCVLALSPDESPALRRAPALVRSFVRLAARNWGYGAFEVTLPQGEMIRIEGPEPGPTARLTVRDYRFVRRVMWAGAVGFGEGYMAGEWDTPDLSELLQAL